MLVRVPWCPSEQVGVLAREPCGPTVQVGVPGSQYAGRRAMGS